MNKKILVIVICALFLTVVLYYIYIGGKNNNANNQNNGNGNNNGGEPELDVDLLVYADKKVYNSSEEGNIILTVSNHMNVSFPFGDYKFVLYYVNKSEFESGDEFTTTSISPDLPDLIDLIKVSANQTKTYYIPFNTTGIHSGSYYIRFVVSKVIPDEPYYYATKDSALFEIAII